MTLCVDFYGLVKELKNKNVYMLIGNGSSNQFRDMRKVKGILKKVLTTVERDSYFLYFGDSVEKDKPSVGYLFELISKLRKDITIVMIQITKAKGYGIPKFVKKVYWHNDYVLKKRWGGLINNKPCSNTKKWVSLNNKLTKGIRKIFIFGGGKITLEEFKVIKRLKIDYQYFAVERKYNKKEKVTSSDSMRNRIGETYKKIE
tara:strand:+ start:572 stop:1177 length:606 start_codon:yes stop_codon:yes gene_type:complete